MDEPAPTWVSETAGPTRAEHLAWCKERALAELEAYPDEQTAIANAMASMFSDLCEHPETTDHIGIELVAMELFCGFIHGREDARRQIEGFN